MSEEICVSVGFMGVYRYLQVTTGVCRNLQLSGGIYTFYGTLPVWRSESTGICNSLWRISKSEGVCRCLFIGVCL